MTPRSTAAGEARETAGLLISVAERTRRSFDEVAAGFDLTPQQARALLALETAAPMRALADHMHCDASNITGIADRLETRGLVARSAQDGDRRVKMLALTEEGRELRSSLEAAVIAGAPVMSALDSKERATLRALLTKVANAAGSRA